MIRIYTDGSCKSNPGAAGAAWCIIYPDGTERTGSKHLGKATNNIAELSAILLALQELDHNEEVEVYSDSKYALGVIPEKTFELGVSRSNNARKNIELIREVKKEIDKLRVFKKHWVKGHEGNAYNELVDGLAKEAADNPGRVTSAKKAVVSTTNYLYNRKKLIQYTIEYLKESDDEKLAGLIGNIFSANISFDKEGDIFNSNIRFINDESDRNRSSTT